LEEVTISNSMNFGLQKTQGEKKVLLLVGWPWKLLHFANFHEFFMFMGKVGETINTFGWFFLDVMIEAKKRAWIDLLLEHLHPKTLNNSFILE
jgi:hypothetical protein